MNEYVHSNSIVRKIWGKSDSILFIFAGAAAEFALNKAVDWLYFTGKLPADPLGRLFSTVTYAREIIFSSTNDANKSIDRMRGIHSSVEHSRGAKIPDEAYRDVLFMLIHYSIASYEVLERKMTTPEKEEVFNVFYRVGERMKLKGLPKNYAEWLIAYEQHNKQNLRRSEFTVDLFRQYRKHLGFLRYFILIEVQKLLVTPRVALLLRFQRPWLIKPVLFFYKLSRNFNADRMIKGILLPPLYKQRIRALDIHPGT